MKRVLMILLALTSFNMASAQWLAIGTTYMNDSDTNNIGAIYGSSFIPINDEPFVYRYLHERYRNCFRIEKIPEDSIVIVDYSHKIYCDTSCFQNIGFNKIQFDYYSSAFCQNTTEECYSGQSLSRLGMLSYIDTIEIYSKELFVDFYPPILPKKVKVVRFINDVGFRSKSFMTNYLNVFLSNATQLNTLEINGFNNYLDYNSITHFEIQHPSLKKLIIKNSSLDSIITLPPQLEYLQINNNGYTRSVIDLIGSSYVIYPVLFSITSFPDSLKYLDFSGNILETLPPFPSKLEYADVSVNKLTALPSLPGSLKTLKADGVGKIRIDFSGEEEPYIYFNNTFPIPNLSNLPPKLEYLSFILSGSSRAELPYPSTLKSLYIGGNKLSKLPTLPSGLKNLGIGINGDSVTFSAFNNYSLPALESFGFSYDKSSGNRQPISITFPSSLKFLTMSSDWFSSYPTFPADLRSLSISDSFLTSLGKLPKNLSELYVKNCPALTCLPVLPASLKTLVTNFSCIPNYTDFIRRGTICNVSKICNADEYGRLNGKVFIDLNSDGIFNGTDINVPKVIVSNNNPGYNFYSSTFSDGNYQMFLDTTGTNILKINATPYLYTTLTPDSINVTPIGNTYLGSTYNFRMVPQPNINDLSVFVTAEGTPPRPGFEAWVKVIAKNKGTVDVNNAEIKLVKPTDWMLFSASITPTSVSGDTLIWKNQSMGKLVGAIDMNLLFSIPQTAVLGTKYQLKGTITPTAADSVLSDNVSIFNGIIVGSYDPNDKQVNPKSLLPDYGDSTKLTYLIRFQNTGTFYAENVIIKDSLPDNVDPATIEVKAASHPYTFSMHERGEIAFIFNGIMLPDSNTNEAASHGYVLFTVKPKKGLELGEKVENKAFIYFDYNDAIITNKAITTLKIETNIINRKELIAKISPNPTSTATKIELSESVNGKVWLYNLQGAMISKTMMENGKSTIETGTLQNGIYLIVIETELGRAAAKLMVQH